VRLDGTPLADWAPDARGRHIGYLPQDIALFDGTIADNIARFDPTARETAITAAARAAGVHEMIAALPGGYATDIGEAGVVLSAGQRQRLGLARALYGEPFLVVLDEPDASLDAYGEQDLAHAVAAVRKRGGIVVVIAHRRSALAAVDTVLALVGGRVAALGPRDAVLAKVLVRGPDASSPPDQGRRAAAAE
jgi:ATP-binding cassette subfamily C protein